MKTACGELPYLDRFLIWKQVVSTVEEIEARYSKETYVTVTTVLSSGDCPGTFAVDFRPYIIREVLTYVRAF